MNTLLIHPSSRNLCAVCLLKLVFDLVKTCFFLLLSTLSQELKWSLSPQTPISWLNVYMQVAYLKETDQLLIPRYPQTTFTQIAEV